MKVLGVIILSIGVLVIVYALLSRFTGITPVGGLLPVHWFSGLPKSEYYKVIPSPEASYSWFISIIIGCVMCFIGWLLISRGE